ncbi:leucine-rich repeat domain-containing protein [uncultured Ruminococcus sp.]|uniref:leucine-rich repeat domain-containing protein n=1 Tax=uncultured Ruminococcus sp. TaxID=165186 RepID=UPI0025E55487|nr:leucine-rich repeat domain-containing protein [uncultured Ruminococcus sp.]
MIDLCKIVREHNYNRLTRTQLVSLLHDYFPTQKREVNLAIIAYDSGIVERIIELDSISSMQLHTFSKQLIDEYGLQETYAVFSIEMWALAFGKSVDKDKVENKQQYIQQHISTSPKNLSFSPKGKIVLGSVSDYELLNQSNNTAIISKFRGFDESNMVIPNAINGKRIIGIGEEAFRNCSAITTLEITDGIEYIENGAFADCKNLKNVILPESIKRIGSIENSNKKWDINKRTGVFQYCTNLESIILPSIYIKEIRNSTFSGCNSLKKIELPEKITEIGSFAFSHCKSLNEIQIPDSVRVISMCAFNECINLTTVVIPEGVEEIDYHAFENCTKLSKVLIPRSVVKIGEDVFKKRYDYRGQLVTIYCYSGSYGLEYARNNKLNIQNANNFTL